MDFKKIKNIITRNLGNKYILTLVVFAAWLIFFDRANVINFIGDVSDGKNMRQQKKYYQEEIKRIDRNLNELNTNDESLEKFAREQYLFKNDDEDVFLIEESRD